MSIKSFFSNFISTFFLAVLFTTTLGAQPAPESTQRDAYKEMYESFFGKAPPEEESVEIPVDLFLDLQPVAKIIILSDSFSKWYKLDKADFITHIAPLLRPSARRACIAELNKMDQWIDTQWLLDKGFRLDYITIKQYLEIRIPPDIKGVQSINLSKRIDDAVSVEQHMLQPSFVSGFSNITYKRTYTDYEEAQETTVTSSSDVIEYVNDITLKNHVAFGDIFLDNQTTFVDDNLSFDELYLSSVFGSSVVKAGFLDLNPLIGLQAENIQISRFLNKSKTFRSFSFSTPEISYLKVKINNSTVYKQTLFPGSYKLTKLPVKTGDNDVSIIVTTKGRQTVYKKEFYTYISAKHLPQYSSDYDIQYALYDRGSGSFEDRIQDFSFTLLNYSVGLGSFLNRYAMTLNTQWNSQHYQDWKQFSLYTGTKSGLLETAFAVSETNTYSKGYFASASFSPSKRLLERWNQKTVLLTGTVQNSDYLDFKISPTNPVGSQGGFYSLSTSFSLFSQRPMTITYERYFSGAQSGKLISGLSKKGRFWEVNTNLALTFTENSVTPFIFFTYKADFQKSGGIAEVTYQPGSKPEMTYGLPYTIGDVPIDISMRPDKQMVGISKSNDDQSLNLSYSTDNELSAKVDGSNSRASYGYIFKKNLTSDAASSYTSTSFHLTTALLFSGKHYAISRPVNNNTFLVASNHDLLKQTDVIIDDELSVDYFGSAGVYYLKPSVKNTIKISPDSIPHNVIIERDNIELTPEFGKGYNLIIGKEAPLIIIGRIIDESGKPKQLVYGKITWDSGEQTFFTNQRGMFQTTLEETGKEFTVQLIGDSSKTYSFTVDEGVTGVRNLKSFSLNSLNTDEIQID